MKRIAVWIALIIVGPSVSAQRLQPTIFPSVYYTGGSYSNGTTSTSYSAYASASLDAFDYIVGGYDNLSIESSTGIYGQRMFVVGGLKNFYPFYLKLHYAGIAGTFREFGTRFTSKDGIDILNAGLQYNVDLFFLGLTYTYANVSGNNDLRCHEAGLTGDWLIHPSFSLSVNPLYTAVTDGRALVSVSAGISYSPWKPIMLHAFGTIGKRAYYFNPENLIVFNQDETQTRLWGVRGELSVVGDFAIVGCYQSSGFVGYTINYLTIGARARFDV
jgi:hypothetical protein